MGNQRKQKKLDKILENFYNETLADENYVNITKDLNVELAIDHPDNEAIMIKAFMYLDNKFQNILRDQQKEWDAKNLAKKEKKNESRGLNKKILG